MFATRVKIFLAALGLLTFVLLLRAMQLQVVQRDQWRTESVSAMIRPEMLSTTRGELLDCKGRVIAEDQSCFDACVDYDALTDVPDSAWLRQTALTRINARSDAKSLSRSARTELLESEQQQVLTDLDSMWKLLARDGGLTLEQLDDLRHAIVQRVELRGESVTNLRFAAAVRQQKEKPPAKWYERIFNESEGDQISRDDYHVDLAEAHQPHAILRAIGNDTRNQLSLLGQKFPWLKVLPSVQRFYPYRESAAQIIGRESAVTRETLSNELLKDEPLRKYGPSDLVGTSGLEKLCEPLLRGARGRIERVYGETAREISSIQPQPGTDVKTTIDIELQQEIQEAFKHIRLKHATPLDPGAADEIVAMPGAAVVIDVPTGEVRALASMPTFDLNQFDEDYSALNADVFNRPLMDRATQLAVEPGSTIKPMVGIGAIMEGVNQVDSTIECTGYFVADGKKHTRQFRCWTMRIATGTHLTVPYTAPHPTGFLTFSDALQRSCNVFFETTAYRLGVDRLADWLSRFGLGRPTGIGITESRGALPRRDEIPSVNLLGDTITSGIGQSRVQATPLQIANEAATLARGGIWIRPHLVPFGTKTAPIANVPPDRVDLQLMPAAVAEAQDGMYRVVNTAGGTGNSVRPGRAFKFAGKTGSAQASFLIIPVGGPVPGDKNVFAVGPKGREHYVRRIDPGTREHLLKEAPWYRYSGAKEDERTHAWYMGYAPADNPKVAIAVLVEFGGGGGAIAGQVFDSVLDALVAHGYLPS